MPKVAKGLTIRQVETAGIGMHADGRGLYLAVGPNGRSWLFRYQVHGKRHEMGLGPFPVVTLAAARDKAIDLQREILAGIDPLEKRRLEGHARRVAKQNVKTFREVAQMYIAKEEHNWRDKVSWPQSLENNVYPIIGDLPVHMIDTPQVREVLEPIWKTKAVTAKRLRGRIAAILDYARVSGYTPDRPNPARWEGHLSIILGKPDTTPEHFEAVPYAKVPGLLARLKAADGMCAKALRFLILTCARASEVTGCNWAEIDLDAGTWTIPKERMKAKREHKVQLTEPALDVLREVSNYRGDDGTVFPGERVPRMTDEALRKCLARVAKGFTVHGFRASFKTWSVEKTDYPGEVGEMILAHKVGTQVEQAYNRSEGIAKRRALLTEWSNFVTSL